ncbi:MAG: TIGR01906 family membrane protein [Clostridia bacterium]|nr:TIGR01906 family membrane protein [Clostridia bacterium]
MTDKKRKTTGTAALTTGFAVLCVIILLTAVHAVGTDAGLYHSEQVKAGILPAAGIRDADLRMLDGRLADYLSGDAAALYSDAQADAPGAPVVQVAIDGEARAAFNEREMAHLQDCYRLFALLRKVRSRLIPWAVLLIAGGAYILQDRRRARLCAWSSPWVLLVPMGIAAAVVAADFDAAFTLFHRALFSNDLWLLDPRTDLLIRICPESMFMHMGVRILIYSLIGILAVSAAATALTFIRPRGKEEDTWNNRDMRRGSGQKQITFGKTGMR